MTDYPGQVRKLSNLNIQDDLTNQDKCSAAAYIYPIFTKHFLNIDLVDECLWLN